MNVSGWVDFWNRDNPIYVNARHKWLHYRGLAQDFSGLITTPNALMLDYGCGEALEAGLLAGKVERLFLYDAAPNIRTGLAARFGENAAITILDDAALETMPEGALDLILIHSVSQYVERQEFACLVKRLAEKLKPGGRLIIGDVIPPGLSPLKDALALLAFGLNGGFLMAAVFGLIRAGLSDYRTLRNRLGLTQYDEADMLGLLAAAGLKAERLPHNPGHNGARMAFAGQRRGEAKDAD